MEKHIHTGFGGHIPEGIHHNYYKLDFHGEIQNVNMACLYGFRNQHLIKLSSTAQRPKNSVILTQMWLLLSRSVL